MEEKRYPLTYSIRRHDPPLVASAIAPDQGACDAVMLTSIIYPDDGSLSVLVVSLDGRTGQEISDKELFKLWILLAGRLGRSKTLDDLRRGFAMNAHDEFWELLRQASGIGG